MNDSYKVRVKHLTEENTLEASEGEMIISQVTGHISVKDKYFVNSATKDVAARNSALYNFYNDIVNNVNILEKEVTNFNKSVNRINRILDNIIKNPTVELDNAEAAKKDTEDTVSLEKQMNDLIYDIDKKYEKIKSSTDENFISVVTKYIDIEKTLKEIELLCREFKFIEQYLINQKYIYYENYKELEKDFDNTLENYENIYALYEEFINVEMKEKCKSLNEKYPEYEIKFEGVNI